MKLLEHKLGDLIGVLNQYRDGYGYKIYFRKKTKEHIIGRSYVTLYDKDLCYEKMIDEMKVISNQQDLLNLHNL